MAALLCDALQEASISVVLSGGAVVQIYSDNAYASLDLDLVLTGLSRRVDHVMNRLGFHKEGRHWRHPDSELWVEFPPGPVQVGDEVITRFAERRTRYGTLQLLAPTECVMDRLAGYYHWNDSQCLEQAVEVARRHPIDLARIEAWSEREASLTKFGIFCDRLDSAGGRR